MNLSKTHNIRSLKSKNEIKDLLANGEKVFTKYGLIFYQNQPATDYNAIAILIKKRCGNAVKRNYIKRIIRSFIREYAEELTAYNRMVFLYTYLGTVTYLDLKERYLKAISKI
jgi:ribonuclease P protein component